MPEVFGAQVSVILSSGYNETEVSHLFHEGEIRAFLQKPYNFTLLCQQVRKALNNQFTPAHSEPSAAATS